MWNDGGRSGYVGGAWRGWRAGEVGGDVPATRSAVEQQKERQGPHGGGWDCGEMGGCFPPSRVELEHALSTAPAAVRHVRRRAQQGNKKKMTLRY